MKTLADEIYSVGAGLPDGVLVPWENIMPYEKTRYERIAKWHADKASAITTETIQKCLDAVTAEFIRNGCRPNDSDYDDGYNGAIRDCQHAISRFLNL